MLMRIGGAGEGAGVALLLRHPLSHALSRAAMASSVDAIRVGIRARPFGKQKGQKKVWDTNEKSLVCTVTAGKNSAAGKKAAKGKQMDFDHVRQIPRAVDPRRVTASLAAPRSPVSEIPRSLSPPPALSHSMSFFFFPGVGR